MKGAFLIPPFSKTKQKKIIPYLIILVVALLIIFYSAIQLMQPVAASSDIADVVRLEIPKGSTTTQISKILKDNGLIRNSTLFRFLTRIKGYDGKYMAGTYILTSDMDVNAIIKEMVEGNVYIDTIRFTIPEGYELRQIADLLDRKGIADKEEFLKEIRESKFIFEFLKDIPERESRLEGYLFPDTYEVYVGESVHSIINRMLTRFEEVAREVGLFQGELKSMTVDDIVIIASIIEREAANDDERPLVSAVFHNRLKKGIKLRSCATVEYLLEERKPRLLDVDLEIDSPYNTYQIQGLPIGPIASPGAESLKAALHPADVDYLYFLVQKDGTQGFFKYYDDFINAKNSSR